VLGCCILVAAPAVLWKYVSSVIGEVRSSALSLSLSFSYTLNFDALVKAWQTSKSSIL